MIEEFKSEEKVLRLLKEVIQTQISPRDFAALNFDVRAAFEQYTISIMRHFYGEQREDTVTVKCVFKKPKTWWQHFKESNFPAWLLKKYPVSYSYETKEKTVSLDRTWIFPNAYIEGHPVLGKMYIHDRHQSD